MTARHPLTELSLEEVPGWIACSGYVTARLRAEPCEPQRLADILHELQQVAEGLVANAAPDEEAEATWSLAGEDPVEGYSSLHDLMLENDIDYWEPTEVVRAPDGAALWAVRMPTEDSVVGEVDTFATRHEAQALCDSARAEVPGAGELDPDGEGQGPTPAPPPPAPPRCPEAARTARRARPGQPAGHLVGGAAGDAAR